MVSSAHTVVVCVVRRRRGDGPGNPRGIDQHSGFVCSQSYCLCCEEEEGGGPGKHGALKVVFQ